ncbi:flagellar basal body P-ring protein FlgI [Pseudomonadales bacterium]|jgi:flagellar P-ring protein precursor FlgI|nr:flagellar basal body P-ring protein FlgI [Pseudomonadales bacterium]
MMIAVGKIKFLRRRGATLLAVALMLLSGEVSAERIKDLASIGGVRENQLIGYGLVVGLQGTGDGKDVSFTGQSLKSILSSLGVTTNPYDDFDLAQSAGRPLELDNVAAVIVTAEIPAFAKPGQRVDVNVSALGVAESLRGGSLIMTRLKGIDGQTYAVAQGAMTVTGINEEVAGTSLQIGVPTSGRIPRGAIIEREVDTPFNSSEYLVFNVHSKDFGTADAITSAINSEYGEGVAFSLDGVSVAVNAPRDSSQRVKFVSMIENIDVDPSEPSARIVVNSRTGTVVINKNVKVQAAAVSHGSLSVRIQTLNTVSQPEPFSDGTTVEIQNAGIAVESDESAVLFEPGVDLKEVVSAVNAAGASTSSLIAILEALKTAGSLHADLMVM